VAGFPLARQATTQSHEARIAPPAASKIVPKQGPAYRSLQHQAGESACRPEGRHEEKTAPEGKTQQSRQAPADRSSVRSGA